MRANMKASKEKILLQGKGTHVSKHVKFKSALDKEITQLRKFSGGLGFMYVLCIYTTILV